MSSSTIRVAVTQSEPVWFDLAGAVSKTCTLIREAASNGAQLVAFPECWIPGYPCWIWSRLVDPEMNLKYIKASISVDSPEMAAIRACARECGVAVSLGFSENAGGEGSVYIAQALIDEKGEMKVRRRKMKPTHMERTIFGDAASGKECLESVGQIGAGGGARVGQLSCWEHIQPLLKFNTIAQGEQIHVAAWPSLTPHSGRDGQDLWSMSSEGCAALSATYAVEASAFVLHCTAVLTNKAVEAQNTSAGIFMNAPGGGASAVFGPDGRRLTDPLDPLSEGIVYADLDLDAITRTRMFAHCTGHYSRPDLMWLGVDRRGRGLVAQQGKGGAGAGEAVVVDRIKGDGEDEVE